MRNNNTDEKTNDTSAPVLARKRGRPPRNCEYEWDENETYLLIECWSKEELLYNASDIFYLHRDSRAQSLNNICSALRRNGVEHSSSSEVRSKMNNLRNYYAAEKRKEKRTADSELPYTSNWKFFNQLRFLDDSYQARTKLPRNKVNDADNITPSSGYGEKESVTLSSQHAMDISPTMIKLSEGKNEENQTDRPSSTTRNSPPIPTTNDVIPTTSLSGRKKSGPSFGKVMKIDNMIQPGVVEKHKLTSNSFNNSESKAPPASSFMTVFRKARKNSKLMYSMNESANFVVETRAILENSSKNFRMNRRTSNSGNLQILTSGGEDSPNNQEQLSPDNGTPSDFNFRNKQHPVIETSSTQHPMSSCSNKNLKISSLDSSSSLTSSVDYTTAHVRQHTSPHATTAITTAADSRSQNLDKCYTDLIYQLLVSMPDSVEKAMLKLDFQQKLIQLKYNNQTDN